MDYKKLELVQHAPYVKGFMETKDCNELFDAVSKYAVEQKSGIDRSKFNRKMIKQINKVKNDIDFNVRTNGKFLKNDVVGTKERLRKKLEERKNKSN